MPKQSAPKAEKPGRAALTDAASARVGLLGPSALAAPKLREVPQAVYTSLSRAGAPQTAYDLIDSVQKNLHRRLHPPTIYRALSQLVARGLIHRLESGSSYVACSSPGEPHQSILFLCKRCGNAEEAVDTRVHGLLQEDADRRKFFAESEVIEVRGVCASCHG